MTYSATLGETNSPHRDAPKAILTLGQRIEILFILPGQVSLFIQLLYTPGITSPCPIEPKWVHHNTVIYTDTMSIKVTLPLNTALMYPL